ncbi:adrenoceptor beta 3 [Cichlidogyrus casuarinus]|uniref:Adrenoceptor beta 3 n=1 Tax=Cichlidogyrus casuarinus TaxID=1844966 RepID=A0ABD2Q2E6_9PLAT
MTLESSTAGPESEMRMRDQERSGYQMEAAGSQSRRKSLLDKTLTLKDIIRTKAAMMPQSSLFSTKEQRAIRTLLIVFGIFVVSWFPFFLLQLIVAWSDKDSELHQKADKLMFEFAWPGYVTSGINPIIYATVSLEFRRALKSIFLYKKTMVPTAIDVSNQRTMTDRISTEKQASNHPSRLNHDPLPIKPKKLGVTFESMDAEPPSKRRTTRTDQNSADHISILQVTQID